MIIPVMLDKVKRKFAYDIILGTFVQVISQIHCDFSCGIPMIASVCKFYGRIRFWGLWCYGWELWCSQYGV